MKGFLPFLLVSLLIVVFAGVGSVTKVEIGSERILLTEPPYSFHGYVYDLWGNPQSNAKVYLDTMDVHFDSTYTNGQGFYNFPLSVPEGWYYIWATKKGKESAHYHKYWDGENPVRQDLYLGAQ